MKKSLSILVLALALGGLVFTGCKDTERSPADRDASQSHEQPDAYYEERIDESADTLHQDRDRTPANMHDPSTEPPR